MHHFLVRESNRLAQELPAGERDSSSFDKKDEIETVMHSMPSSRAKLGISIISLLINYL